MDRCKVDLYLAYQLLKGARNEIHGPGFFKKKSAAEWTYSGEWVSQSPLYCTHEWFVNALKKGYSTLM